MSTREFVRLIGNKLDLRDRQEAEDIAAMMSHEERQRAYEAMRSECYDG